MEVTVIDKLYKVKGEERYVAYIADYQNGIDTTGGFYERNELEPCDNAVSITYDSAHATELPIDWFKMTFLDDNNKRQGIQDIRFEQEPAYVMQDNTLSYEVTT